MLFNSLTVVVCSNSSVPFEPSSSRILGRDEASISNCWIFAWSCLISSECLDSIPAIRPSISEIVEAFSPSRRSSSFCPFSDICSFTVKVPAFSSTFVCTSSSSFFASCASLFALSSAFVASSAAFFASSASFFASSSFSFALSASFFASSNSFIASLASLFALSSAFFASSAAFFASFASFFASSSFSFSPSAFCRMSFIFFSQTAIADR